jgi:hypothetical protein
MAVRHATTTTVELALLIHAVLGPTCTAMVWHPKNSHNSMWDTWCALLRASQIPTAYCVMGVPRYKRQ